MKYLIWSVFYLFTLGEAKAQFVFEHITDKQGLVNSNVTSIVKDSQGFMWFGTYNGLSKYDGYKFTNYQYKSSDSTGIPESYIRCLFESKAKELYIGFQYHGFAIFDKRSEKFISFVHREDDSSSLIHNYVLTIHEDSKGNIWIGTRLGLDLFDRASGTFTHFYPFKNAPKPFVTSISEDNDGNLWLSGLGRQICRFSYKTKSKPVFQYYTFSKSIDLDFEFNNGSVIKFYNNSIYIGTETALYKFDLTSLLPVNVDLGLTTTPTIVDFLVDHSGTLYIATDGQGMFYKKVNQDSFTQLLKNPNIPTTIGANAVLCIYESAPGVLWIGTYAAGVSVCNLYKQKFQGINDIGTYGNKLLQSSVLALAEAPDNQIWAGTDGGGLHLINLQNKHITYFNTQNSAICGDVVKSISTSKEPSSLWIGTYNKGMCFFDYSKNKATCYKTDPSGKGNGILRNDIWSLLEDSKQNLWIGTLSAGLNFYSKKENRFKYFTIDSSAYYLLANCNIFSLMEDSKERIWITTETVGFVCYEYATQKFTRFMKSAKKNGLPSNDIRDVFEDSQGQIWVATVNSGLCRLTNFSSQEFETYDNRNGLNTLHIVGILEDNKHQLWLSTDKGISLFNPVTKSFRNFDSNDGLISKSYNYNSKLRLPNGYLCFGGISGLTYFHPDSIVYNQIKPSVVLTDIKLFNHSVSPGQMVNGKVVLPEALSSIKEIKLDYTDYVVSFEFSALDFTAPEKNLYAYRLDGFDKEWIYTPASKRFATYTNLEPGEYVFRVKAANNDGVWNEEGLSIRVVVSPPWWSTWWFRLLVVLFIILVSVGFYYYRFQSIRRRNKELMEEVRLRTKDLEEQQAMKDKFYAILAHDLKNPVGALHMLSEMNRKELEEKGSSNQKDIAQHLYLSSTRIKDLVLNLLDWIKSQNTKLLPNRNKMNVWESWKEILDLHKTQADLKHITILLKIPKGLIVFADKTMFLTIGRNLISNTIKYTHLNGTIEVEAFLDNSYAVITIKDKGDGFSAEVIKRFQANESITSTKGTQDEMGSGLGLSLAREFVHMLGGTIELQNTDAPGGLITIRLPYAEIVTESTVESETITSPLIENSTGIQIAPEVLHKHILIVEDDPSTRKAILNLLKPFFTIQEAASADEAIEEIKQWTPDLVISDIQMPGKNGIAFCKDFKNNNETSHIPLILITSETESNYQRKGVEAGADAFIYKPFDTSLFIATINNLFLTLENYKLKFGVDPLTQTSILTKNEANESFLNQIIKLIENNLDDSELNGDYLAMEVGLSRSIFYAKLKSLTGQTVNNFIKSTRLKRSALLLLEGKNSIAQIAYLVGFNDPSYFTKVFSKHFGCTPKEYVAKKLPQY